MLTDKDVSLLQQRMTFWPDLTPAEKNILLGGSQAVSFHTGQFIHCGQRECIGVLIIKSGTLRVFITSDEGREITLYRLNAGDICILSASCILENIWFEVSIDAETDCEAIQIAAPAFSRLTAANIYAELFSYQLAAARFSEVMWAMQQVLFTRFDKRLAGFLLEESRRIHSPVIKMTHEQIARHLGSAREVVSRMLKYFSKEGMVTLARGGITITDADKLAQLTS